MKKYNNFVSESTKKREVGDYVKIPDNGVVIALCTKIDVVWVVRDFIDESDHDFKSRKEAQKWVEKNKESGRLKPSRYELKQKKDYTFHSINIDPRSNSLEKINKFTMRKDLLNYPAATPTEIQTYHRTLKSMQFDL